MLTVVVVWGPLGCVFFGVVCVVFRCGPVVDSVVDRCRSVEHSAANEDKSSCGGKMM